MASLSIRNVTKSFKTANKLTAVLKGINLTIEDGEFLTLVGPSGCGKSTLLRIIAGLETQSGGTVSIADAIVDQVHPKDRNVAMVFQSYALYPHLSVFDNIAVPLRMRQMPGRYRVPVIGSFLPGRRQLEAAIREKVETVADALQIRPLLARKPGHLSGGQRQRVALGRAMVRDPAAFLMDEPLSNLDAKLRVHMRAEIAQLHRRLKTTFIYVTHDQAEAMTMSDRIAVMMDGEILQLDAPQKVYSDPQDLRVAEFIGSPKINVFQGQVVDPQHVAIGPAHLPLVTGLPAGTAVQIAIRPEATEPLPAASAVKGKAAPAAGIAIQVTHIENLGSDILLHATPDDAPAAPKQGPDSAVIVRLKPTADNAAIAVGSRIFVRPQAGAALLFDMAGKRLPLPHVGQSGQSDQVGRPRATASGSPERQSRAEPAHV